MVTASCETVAYRFLKKQDSIFSFLHWRVVIRRQRFSSPTEIWTRQYVLLAPRCLLSCRSLDCHLTASPSHPCFTAPGLCNDVLLRSVWNVVPVSHERVGEAIQGGVKPDVRRRGGLRGAYRQVQIENCMATEPPGVTIGDQESQPPEGESTLLHSRSDGPL